MNFVDFTNELKNRLQNFPLPGQDAQYIMAGDNIRYSRINLDVLSNYKKSAVCLLFYPHQNEVCFVLMKRPKIFQYHAGQIALPGGACDDGETYEQTAIRELYEETNANILEEHIIGKLTPLYIPVSNFYIQPIVACINEKPVFIPNIEEVDELIECTLPYILRDDIVSETMVNLTTSGLKIKAPYFNVQGNVLWGATAMLLSEVKQLLLQNQTTFSSLFR